MKEPNPRLAVVIIALFAVQAALCCLVLLAPPSWKLVAAMVPLASLPAFICGAAIALVALLAPSWQGTQSDRDSLNQVPIGALWQADLTAFFLLVASRVTPLAGETIAISCLWVWLAAYGCLLLARIFPRPYAGIVFFWMVALPTLGYLLSEVFLVGDGSMSLSTSQSPNASKVRMIVDALFFLSPVTAAAQALSGKVCYYSMAAVALTVSGIHFVMLRKLASRVSGGGIPLQPADRVTAT